MPKLKAPDGAISASVGGQEYLVKDGMIDVPESAVPALLEHGFTLAPEKAKK